MSRLVWHQPDDQKYEAGVDRGVLYLPDNTGVVWNGLTSVEDDLPDLGLESYYLDGIKYLVKRGVSDYSGSLTAFTYPEEFEQFDGVKEVEPGFLATAQPVGDMFGLSYRTLIGDPSSSLGDHYKLHVLYNLTAVPDARTFSTINGSASAQEFSWKLTGIPVNVPGMRPTVHIMFDTTRVPPEAITAIENYLYGDSTGSALLTTPDILLEIYQDATSLPIDGISAVITEPI